MGKYFSREEILPIIEEGISEVYQEKHDFVLHGEIVEVMLSVQETYDYIEDVSKDMGRTTGWVAGNMVAWFGQ